MGYFCNHRFIYLVIKRKYNNAAVSRLANVHFQDQVPGSRNTHTHTHTCSCLKLHINVPNMRQVSSHSAKEQIHATLMKFYHFLTLLTWRFRKDFDYCVFFFIIIFFNRFLRLSHVDRGQMFSNRNNKMMPSGTVKICLWCLWLICSFNFDWHTTSRVQTGPKHDLYVLQPACLLPTPLLCHNTTKL